jgi:hypothetical protein
MVVTVGPPRGSTIVAASTKPTDRYRSRFAGLVDSR